MKRNLYIDCDGVTFDTEPWAFQKMQELGFNFENDMAIRNFFATCDWYTLFFLGGELNGSIAKIHDLVEKQIFNKVYGLSTYSLYSLRKLMSNEVEAKEYIYQKYLPFIDLITTPAYLPKHERVDPKGNILVDNGLSNILGWVKNGGIGVYFVKDLKNCYHNCGSFIKPYEYGSNQPYFIIDDLSYLEEINKVVTEKEWEETYFGFDPVIKRIMSLSPEEFLRSPEYRSLREIDEKIDCYFDYDGVIVDLYQIALSDIQKRIAKIQEDDLANGIIHEPKHYLFAFRSGKNHYWNYIIEDYFKNIDWEDLLTRCPEIDNAREKIALIKKANIFRNVGVASNINTYLNEGYWKEKSLEPYGLTLFKIPFNIAKSAAIPPLSYPLDNEFTPLSNILVDDSRSKVLDFIDHGGIGVLYLQNHQFTLPDEGLNRPYYIIGDLNEIYKVLYLVNYLRKSYTLKKTSLLN